MTNFTFEDTLTQIGLGYLPLFLIGLARPWVRWVALGVILVGYWGAFAAYPCAGPDFDYQAVGVPADWPHHADRARRALEQERQPGLGRSTAGSSTGFPGKAPSPTTAAGTPR